MTDVLAGQVLRFQWNNYTTSWGPAIRDLRRAGLFHDLTLVTSDNQLVTAHRIVLAACSAFFRGQIRLFVNLPRPHQSCLQVCCPLCLCRPRPPSSPPSSTCEG